jgi:LEA14-like dessication related protein
MVIKRLSIVLIVVHLAALAGCATLEDAVRPPEVRLADVELESLEVDEQRFLLTFDVSNPNPFPLPIAEVRYGIALDGYRFASGAAASEFTVPAGGDGRFAISVDVNLLDSAPQLLFIVREGVYREIGYSLEGRLRLGLPAPVSKSFETSGVIQLTAAAR